MFKIHFVCYGSLLLIGLEDVGTNGTLVLIDPILCVPILVSRCAVAVVSSVCIYSARMHNNFTTHIKDHVWCVCVCKLTVCGVRFTPTFPILPSQKVSLLSWTTTFFGFATFELECLTNGQWCAEWIFRFWFSFVWFFVI